MLYEMLTGRLPFTGDNAGALVLAHLQQPAPDPRGWRPELPAAVSEAVLRALAKEPEARFATPGDLARALG
jgi:serine/threonine-protein kinase